MKAFYNAESGLELWKYDLVKGIIVDNGPTDINWSYTKTYYDNGINTTVTGVHATEVVSGTTQVKKENGKPIYRITSNGYEQESHRVTEMVFIFNPGMGPPAAVYSERPVIVNGASTRVDGNDSCGGGNKPGILTSGSTATITIKNGLITGDPATSEKQPDAFAIKDTVNSLKSLANLKYGQYTSNVNISGADVAGKWGTPTITDADTPMPIPSGGPVIVYIDANVVNTVKLIGQVNGAGILMVDGDLDIAGGFNWFGLVIATGAVKFSGNGNRNITGGVITGESADLGDDATFIGGIGIFYCSKMADWLKQKVRPTRMVSWREIF
jgi:hypothetical protein